MFQYPLNLHCSQTVFNSTSAELRFNTLWIYTALKRIWIWNNAWYVSIPSEFTLLSNYCSFCFQKMQVSIPSEFTLLSNNSGLTDVSKKFQYPLNLHCSQTFVVFIVVWISFQYPLNLHCSQTISHIGFLCRMFQYPLNLHCSQTWACLSAHQWCFNTLWIYTALKLILPRESSFLVSIPSEFTLLSNLKFLPIWESTLPDCCINSSVL